MATSRLVHRPAAIPVRRRVQLCECGAFLHSYSVILSVPLYTTREHSWDPRTSEDSWRGFPPACHVALPPFCTCSISTHQLRPSRSGDRGLLRRGASHASSSWRIDQAREDDYTTESWRCNTRRDPKASLAWIHGSRNNTTSVQTRLSTGAGANPPACYKYREYRGVKCAYRLSSPARVEDIGSHIC